MSKNRKRGAKLINRLKTEVPSPNEVEQMFNDVENSSSIENNISRKIERKKFGTQLRPDLIKLLKQTAINQDTTITDLLEKILEDYLS